MQFLIVEDEPLARADLARAIRELMPSVRIAQAANVSEARGHLESITPDAVFLDLEMAGGHGSTLLPELNLSGIPVVITTAHEEFAVQAFDHDVSDYLLKPIEAPRLARAIARLRGDAGHAVDGNEGTGDDFILLSDQQHCWPVKREDIVLVEAEGSYSTLHIRGQKSIVLSRSLKDLHEVLGPRQFVRANRSQLIGLRFMKTIQKQPGGTMAVSLEGFGKIEFSRRQAQAFRNEFEK